MGRTTPYWEENGFTSEWYYHAHRIKMERLTDDELVRLVRLHGEKAAELLRTSIVCPNVRRYATVMQRIRDEAKPQDADLPLFASRETA